MVGACVGVGVAKLLIKWLLCGSHMAGSAVTDLGGQLPGRLVEWIGRQTTTSSRHCTYYVYR